MLSVDPKDLEGLPPISEGQEISCPICDELHEVHLSDEFDYRDQIYSFQCGNQKFVAGVLGKNILRD